LSRNIFERKINILSTGFLSLPQKSFEIRRTFLSLGIGAMKKAILPALILFVRRHPPVRKAFRWKSYAIHSRCQYGSV
jgi:hypothetical protein